MDRAEMWAAIAAVGALMAGVPPFLGMIAPPLNRLSGRLAALFRRDPYAPAPMRRRPRSGATGSG